LVYQQTTGDSRLHRSFLEFADKEHSLDLNTILGKMIQLWMAALSRI